MSNLAYTERQGERLTIIGKTYRRPTRSYGKLDRKPHKRVSQRTRAQARHTRELNNEFYGH